MRRPIPTEAIRAMAESVQPHPARFGLAGADEPGILTRHRDIASEAWKIVDGKLYLNCSQAAYERWSRDIPGHVRKADAIREGKFGKQ
jgi:hypothetical protein